MPGGVRGKGGRPPRPTRSHAFTLGVQDDMSRVPGGGEEIKSNIYS